MSIDDSLSMATLDFERMRERGAAQTRGCFAFQGAGKKDGTREGDGVDVVWYLLIEEWSLVVFRDVLWAWSWRSGESSEMERAQGKV